MRMKISAENMRGDFLQMVEELSGQKLFSCYQCGKCTAGCPVASDMDILPAQVVRLVQLGQYNDVLKSKTIWICASCLTCSVRCPKGVDLARLMESLRTIFFRENPAEPSMIPGYFRLPQQALVSFYRKFTR